MFDNLSKRATVLAFVGIVLGMVGFDLVVTKFGAPDANSHCDFHAAALVCGRAS
jgi:hypothetical protein